MAVGNDERISRLMETAERLRAVRAAQRRFLMLWAADHPDAFVEATVGERDAYRSSVADFLKRSSSRWSN